MKRVTIVQSFDGHPIGDVVEMTDAQADSAVIQKRGVVMPEGSKGKTKGSKPKYDGMNKADLMALCDERDIVMPLKATKPVIVELLEAADAE